MATPPVADEAAAGAAAPAEAADRATEPETAVASETTSEAEPAARQPLIFQERAEGVEVIQAAEGREAGGVTIDSVTYDGAGAVSIAGRGAPGGDARLYLDDALEDMAPIRPDGSWRVTLPREVPPALYTLRVDQTTPTGVVTSRAETPFERANPEDITIEKGAVVVQPGNNLWRIASYVYGDGARYSVIYASNQAQIRDPNLIYPGQVFTLPEAAGSSAP